jgi:hypothetical protein
MERGRVMGVMYIYRFKLFLLIVFFLLALPVYANEAPNPLTVPQTNSFETCCKTYNMPADKLFYLTLASINANRFKINEIQSKTGYVLFTVANRQFLAGIVKISSAKSLLKITPASNNYYFPPGIVSNTFKYIDLNASTDVAIIKKGG